MMEMWISLGIINTRDEWDIWHGICNQCIVSLLIRDSSYVLNIYNARAITRTYKRVLFCV
jgi:hypothetical protein